MMSKHSKSEKFNGLQFNRWQEQMHAWLITLGLVTAIGKKKSPFAKAGTSETIPSSEEIEFHYRFRILSCLF